MRYLRELEARRTAVLDSNDFQGKLTVELKSRIEAAADKASLEDLYLPYQPKRRTKAMIAREAGLESLAEALLANPLLVPEVEAQAYVRAEPVEPEARDTVVADVKAALEGARQILMERFAEDAGLLARVREYLMAHGVVESTVIAGQQEAGAKFADYYHYRETWKTIPSHRALAVFRGRNEGFLTVKLLLDAGAGEEKPSWSSPFNACEDLIAGHAGIVNKHRPADK